MKNKTKLKAKGTKSPIGSIELLSLNHYDNSFLFPVLLFLSSKQKEEEVEEEENDE